MCGIAGIWAPGHATDASRRLEDMLDNLVHRGPDGRGTWSFGSGAIGMVRLALLDLTDRGQQPLYACDNRVGIVFNGEVYNFRQEREFLEARGYRFQTRTDTEVELASFLEHGLNFAERLRGMFALGIVDLRSGPRLVLARDPLGIKPLYVAESGHQIAFASEAQSLVRAGIVDGRLDSKGVEDYLNWGFVPGPRTVYSGIRLMAAGSIQVFEEETAAARRYYKLPSFRPRTRSIGEAAEELRETLENSVKAHAFADAEVGAFLSGGVDSTAISALMRPHVSGALKTFTLRFPDVPGGEGESEQAEAWARRLECDHQTVDVTLQDISRSFDAFVAATDQPSTDGLNTWLVSRAAGRSVKGVLSGLGADELFGGYPTSRRISALRTPKGRSVQAIARAVGLLGNHLTGDRLRGIAARSDSLAIWRHAHRALPASTLARLLPDSHDGRAMLRATLQCEDPDWRRSPSVEQAAILDLALYMRDQLLRDSDVMSMAHSLELRVPFVDVNMVAFARSVPPEQKVRARSEAVAEYGGSGAKRVLLEAVKDVLPPDIFSRPKRGFSLPFDRWLNGPLRDRLVALEDPRAPIWSHVDRSALGALSSLPAFPARFSLVVLNGWLLSR